MKKIFFLVPIGIVLFLIAVVGIMAVFRLCPPIQSGPQPPWCVNEQRWEQDMAAVPDFMQGVKEDLGPVTFEEEDLYVPSTLPYITEEFVRKDYSIDFGIGPADYYWTVCVGGTCLTPREGLYSTFARAESLGSRFVYVTDFIRFDSDLDLFTDSKALSEKEAAEIIDVAKKYGQKTMFTTNLYISDNTVRHSESNHSGDFMYSDVQDNILYKTMTDVKINKVFDQLEEKLTKSAKKFSGADYMVATPGHTAFQFGGDVELKNRRMKELIAKVKENFDGKVCVPVELKELDTIDYYKDADCVVVGMSFIEDITSDVPEDADAVAAAFDRVFADGIFSSGKEIFLLVMMLSYDGAMQEGWFEAGDYEFLGLDYAEDQKEQAIVYEGIFRSIYRNEVPLKGVFSYGYWWNKELGNTHQELGNTIRGKDAEHVFYRWQQIMGN